MTTVVLFEKSSAKREAEKVLPREIVGVALSGHMLAYKRPDRISPDLLQKIFVGAIPEAPYDGPWIYENLPFLVRIPPYEIGTNRDGSSHRDAIASLRDKLKGADTVIVATDPGREGSLIAWELLQYCGYKGKVLRMKLGATDAKSIEKAYRECIAGGTATGDRDYCRYMEGLARQMQDYLSGMNGTRCMNIAFPRRKEEQRHSFGEVIMRVLGLLAELEDEIANFKPETFYKVGMDVDQKGIRGRLVHAPDPVLKDKAQAERIAALAKSWKGPLSVQSKERRSGPPSLFSAAKMFKEAASLFGWKAAKTESVMQELYDKGYATYPRTETDFLHVNDITDAAMSPGARLAAIAETLPDLAALVDHEPHIRRTGNGTYRNEESEHYAFVPTSKPLGADASDDAKKLYEVVAKRFVAHHMPDAVDLVTKVKAVVQDGATARAFGLGGRVEQAQGWRQVYAKSPDEAAKDEKVSRRSKPGEEEEEESVVPPFVDGAAAEALGSALVEGTTQPPRRITFGGLAETCQRLIDWVEDPKLKAALHNEANPNQPKGLGTAASAKEFDKKLLEFDYIREFAGEAGGKKKRGKSKDPAIQVTERGMDVWRFFRKEMPDAVDPVARAQTEYELGQIGNTPTRAAADDAYRSFLTACHEKQRALVAMFVRTRPRAPAADPAIVRAVLATGRPIEVPYGKNDQARAAGARWDKEREVWVAPADADFSVFEAFGCRPIEGDVAEYKRRKNAQQEARKSGGTPIEVPWDDAGANRAKVKALGAIWSPNAGTRGSWVVPEGIDLAPFEKAGFRKWDPGQAPARAAASNGSASNGKSASASPRMSPPPQNAIYLNVKYEDREKAKKLGARWDGDKKKWYAPAGANTAAFRDAGFV